MVERKRANCLRSDVIIAQASTPRANLCDLCLNLYLANNKERSGPYKSTSHCSISVTSTVRLKEDFKGSARCMELAPTPRYRYPQFKG